MSANKPPVHFRCEPAPDAPDWLIYELGPEGSYNRAVLGNLLCRREGDVCRVRLPIQPHHINSAGRIHGGIVLGLIDVGMFSAFYVLCGVEPAGSVTVDLQCQFIGPGDGSRPLDLIAEVLRETGRLVFLRGKVVQDDELVASFSSIGRKPTREWTAQP